MVKVRVRAERSDAGQLRLMGRDYAALAWLADMKAISEPDLGVLLGQLAGKEPVTVHAAKSVVRRWTKLGLADVKKVLAGEPRVITVTKKGAELVGEERWTELAWTSLPHLTAVARARLWLEVAPPHGMASEGWLSEVGYRRKYHAAVSKGHHVPDGVLIVDGGREIAVEVERRAKTVERTANIVSDLRFDPVFQGALYVIADQVMDRTSVMGQAATGQVERTVRAAIDRSVREREGGSPVGVLTLPNDLMATIREKGDTAGQ